MSNDFERIHKKLDEMSEQITLVRVDVGQLKIKSSLWGFTGGLFAIILVWARAFFIKH